MASMTQLPSQYSFPTNVIFGAGVSKQLSEILQQNKVSRPLIVTDVGVAKLEWFQSLASALNNAAVFSDVHGNPVKSQVEDGIQAFRDHNADSIVAVGGGAATDVAKAIALMIHHPGDLFDYADEKQNADADVPFLIAIPTTAGTGSEVGHSSVISDDQTKVKKVISSPKLLPKIVLADPTLTLGLPPHITAATGLDALTHLIEAFLAQGHQPLCDGIALEGMRLVSESLVSCYTFAKNGDKGSEEHLQARSKMLDASMMGAIAFQKGLGANHSCAHALSTVCDLHHGLANAIMLPYVMAFNMVGSEARFERMQDAVNTSEGFVDWIRNLNQELEIPNKLSEVGVTEGHLDQLVDIACADSCHDLRPRVVTANDFRALFTEALN